ncbi:hypothetical protein SEA_VINCENZO_92 [Mycobacterium phage Vincenzo]|uniref:Uncharacterized protein n=2 Tax=Coopervirus vincenzo TaxID=1983110 RepID=A0A0F6WDU0_9CAUD|nr:hypothetical protein SEA_VINCENZO_92 [Mycobacterium phage Vincenzo]AKF14354.1 hypothetical protein SEA_VINCENZO_92 [Mycobacterium phage Vincenzo]AKF14758.1 hypothetical protein SEA_ALANGRANT_93 [Mycobacterium phage AlanGrant]
MAAITYPAAAYFNPVTGNVWVQAADGPITRLRSAADKSDAYTAVGEAGLVRTGNWVPTYGPVVTATLATTKSVTVTITVPGDVQPLDVAERLEGLLPDGYTVTDSALVR